MAPSVVLLSCAAVALLLLHVVEAFPPHDNRIFGGYFINISEVPFQVAMYLDGEYQCGGSIISEHWILSAAHCTNRKYITSLGVRVGSNEHASGGQYYVVEKVVEHKKYEHMYDISLLKTSKPIVFSDKVGVARLPAQDAALPAVGTELLVSGWGRTDNVNNNGSPELKAVRVKLVDFSKCEEEKLYVRLHKNASLQICAFTSGRDSCSGDSGGPLVADVDTLVGIVSYGPTKCGTTPAVYTKVSAFRDWITEISGV